MKHINKKILAVFCGSLVFLGGCSDATTQISDKSEVLITVGNDKISKGDIYNGLLAQGSVSTIENQITKFLVDKEVPVSEELEKEAKKTLKEYREAYGDDWKKTYKNAGFETEEAFYEDVVLVNTRAEKLTAAYIEQNYEDSIERFNPRKVQIIEIEDAADAEKAFEMAQENDSDFEAIAKEYGTKTYKGTEAIYNSESGLPDVVWNKIDAAVGDDVLIDSILQDVSNEKFYIVRVTNSITETFKEEAIENMKEISGTITSSDTGLKLSEEAFNFFLKKYDYSIHDITVYEALLSASEQYKR